MTRISTANELSLWAEAQPVLPVGVNRISTKDTLDTLGNLAADYERLRKR